MPAPSPPSAACTVSAGHRWSAADGSGSPGGNPLIVRNHAHVVHLAEFLYGNTSTAATLSRYRDLVEEIADCMASVMCHATARACYILGLPIWSSHVIYRRATSQNPANGLSYWSPPSASRRHCSITLGLPRDPFREKIRAHLAPLPLKDGPYVTLESISNS